MVLLKKRKIKKKELKKSKLGFFLFYTIEKLIEKVKKTLDFFYVLYYYLVVFMRKKGEVLWIK